MVSQQYYKGLLRLLYVGVSYCRARPCCIIEHSTFHASGDHWICGCYVVYYWKNNRCTLQICQMGKGNNNACIKCLIDPSHTLYIYIYIYMRPTTAGPPAATRHGGHDERLLLESVGGAEGEPDHGGREHDGARKRRSGS